MAALPPVPSESDVFTALRTYLLSILPSGVEVVQWAANQVPEPQVVDYVVMTPVLRRRLTTSVDDNADATYTGSIAGSVLNVTAVEYGTLAVGQPVYGVSVAAGTQISSLGTGTGGAGTYGVAPTQTVSSEALASGTTSVEQDVELTVQCDVHGPGSADNAQTISNLTRDQFGYAAIQALNTNIAPISADDPRQVTWVNEEQQYEKKWTVDVVLQVCETVYYLPQQFAAQLQVDPILVQATYT